METGPQTGLSGSRSLHVAILAAALACAIAVPAAAGQADEVSEGAGAEVEAKAKAVQLVPNLPIQRHYYNPSTGKQRVFGGELSDENLAYSNTPPPEVYLALGLPNTALADDLMIVAIGGCDITAYEVMVAGGGDGNGPGFTATIELYDRCPHGGGEIIPGAGGSITVDNDGLHAIVVDLSDAPVAVSKTIWLAVSCDSGSAGWVLGTPAEIGFTANVYDFVYNHCAARFSGTTLYAGFHARVWCEPPFETEFPAYLNNDLTGQRWGQGAGSWTMDDVELIVDDCILTGYEIGAIGSNGGEVTVTAELRSQCGAAYTIEGTQGAAQFIGDESPVFARVSFPGGFDLSGSDSFWMAFNFTPAAQGILSGRATLGHTGDYFGLADGDGCSIFWWGGPYAGFAINIYCLGSTPVGACCDLRRPQDERCRETTEFACDPYGRERRWSEGRTCDDPAAFDPPCGMSACCTPPEGPGGEGCFDLTQGECEAIVDDVGDPAAWQPGLFCGDSGHHCVRWPCRYADGACDVPHGTPGCMTAACCDEVCDVDPYCCEVEWDWNCVRGANNNYCGASVPVSYDRCWSNAPGRGAIEVGANSTSYLSNLFAARNYGEKFCCHPDGGGGYGDGGIWAKFTATDSTARVDTCGTVDEDATDSLLQLMRAADHTSEQSACESLTPIACNDDGDCGDGHAVICAGDLVAGETYYILLDSKTSETAGEYVLTVTSPAPPSCPDPDRPGNDTCWTAIAIESSTVFDLTGANPDCTWYSCGASLGNVWFEYVAPESGVMVFDTCAEPENDTVLAAYEGTNCPVTGARRLACSSGGGTPCGAGARMWFDVVRGTSYLIRVGAPGDGPLSGTLAITPLVDCQPNGRPDALDIERGLSQDCNRNDVPDECDLADRDSQDCNRNDVPDECDVADGVSEDANGNGVPDECEVCATGPMEFIGLTIGGDGVWRDAGQPHVEWSWEGQGRSMFDFLGPAGSDNVYCWTLCETNGNSHLRPYRLMANDIAQIFDRGDGWFTIVLERPATPGEVTTLV